MKKISPFNLDRYGSREERAADMNKADNIFANGVFGGLAVFIFVLIDFVCLRVVWNLVQTENPFFIDCIAVACAAALDVPLAIAAIVLKKYTQGLYDRQGNRMARAHEFHYWDSTRPGKDLKAVKPLSSREWDCMIVTDQMIAGFPHLYYASGADWILRFLEGKTEGC